MDFGTFPHSAYQLMSAAEQHLCLLQGAVYRYIGGMLWDEFGQHQSTLLSRAMDFGTFPPFGLSVDERSHATPMPPSRSSVWVYWVDVVR
jgi:nitrate/nitrite transporter NarK